MAGQQQDSSTAVTDERERLAAQIVGLMIGSSSGVQLNASGPSNDDHTSLGTPLVNCVPTMMGGESKQ